MIVTTAVLFLVPVLYLLGYVVYQRHIHPLSNFPGPFWGSVTNLWRFYHELKGDLPLAVDEYHKKYGPFVRVAPDEVNSNSAEVIDVVYKKGGRHYVKSHFYDGFTTIEPNMFGTRDEDLHSLRRRQMAHAFSQASLLKMEYIFDRHVRALLAKLDKKAQEGKPFQIVWPLRFFSYDCNGELSMGSQFGTQEKDDQEQMPRLNDHFTLAKLTGYVPQWKTLFARYGKQIPWPYLRRLLSSRAQIAGEAFRVTDVEFKRAGRDDDGKTADVELEDEEGEQSNLLRGLVRAKDPETGELIPRKAVASNVISFLAAGSHSTTSTLEIFWWYLLHYPQVKGKVVKEIDGAFDVPVDNNDIVPFVGLEAALPYTATVWKETWRLSPTFQSTAPRMTPLAGDPRYPTQIEGMEIPPNTAMSASIYSLHRNSKIWGSKPDEFLPERWLEDGQARTRETLMMHFGQGHRACIGRNQAMIMLWKAVVEILRRFDVVLADEEEAKEKQCRLRVTGFAEPREPLEVKVTRRVSRS